MGRDIGKVAGRGARAALLPSNELTGNFVPRVVPSPSGDYVLYTAWEAAKQVRSDLSFADQGIAAETILGVPVIRRLDLLTGKDTEFARNAFSAAIAPDGRVAYVEGMNAAGVPATFEYPTRLVVRAAENPKREVWSESPGIFIAAAWAGPTLLAYRGFPGSEVQDLVALDGPGDVRAFGDETLSALNDDGSLALLVKNVFLEAGAEKNPPSVARIARVSDGQTVAELSSADALAKGVQSFAPAGDWSGDRLVVPGVPGAVVLRHSESSLSVEDVVALDKAEFPYGAERAAFSDRTGTHLELWASAPTTVKDNPVSTDPPPPGLGGGVREHQRKAMECSRNARKCTAGSPASPLLTGPVFNPSRPK